MCVLRRGPVVGLPEKCALAIGSVAAHSGGLFDERFVSRKSVLLGFAVGCSVMSSEGSPLVLVGQGAALMYLAISVFVRAACTRWLPKQSNTIKVLNLISRQRESLQCRTTRTKRKNITTRVL